MRKRHAFGAATVGALLLAGIPVGAQDAPEGIGTSSGTSSVVVADIGADGAVLSLRAIGDDAQSSTDPNVGTPEAFASIHPLSLSSGLVPALNVELPPVEVRSTGAEQKLDTQAVDLESLATSGTVDPASLSAVVDELGARSGLSLSLTDVGLVAGLLSVDKISATLATSAAKAASEATRGVAVQNLTVIDLGALLAGLGIPLDQLPLATATALLAELGLPVDGVPAANVRATVDALNKGIDDAQALITTVTSQGLGTVCQPGGALEGLNGIVGGLPSLPIVPTLFAADGAQAAQTPALPTIVCDATTTVEGLLGQLNATVDGLQDRLNALLSDLLATLAGTPLLSVEGVEAGLTTKALDTVEGSVATAEAKIGAINVGTLDLGGIDVLATADQLNGLLDGVSGALGDVLGTIDPGLSDLVAVSVLDRKTEVTEADGYVQALASLTALTADIKPPTDLAAIVARLLNGAGVGDLITGAGGTVPTLEPAMGALGAAVGGQSAAAGDAQAAQVPDLVGALAGGTSTIQVASLGQVSNFTPVVENTPAAPVTPAGGELPRTGGETVPALLVAALLAAAAYGIRRVAKP